MDPITASTAFATIIGLICNFRQERSGSAALDHRNFIEWLEYHRHEEIKDLLATNDHLKTEVDKLLQQGQGQILDQLAHANGLLAQLLCRVDGLSGIAQILAPAPEFSGQAILMEQLEQSGFPEMGLQRFIGGFRLVAFLASGPPARRLHFQNRYSQKTTSIN